MNRIAEIRKTKGLTQDELAALLGIAQNTLCQYETGKRAPDSTTLMKIGDIFGVSVAYILGRSSESAISDLDRVPTLSEANRIIVETDPEDINVYLSLGWRLLHIGTVSTSNPDGTMDSYVEYILGWFGDSQEAPQPEMSDSSRRGISYL